MNFFNKLILKNISRQPKSMKNDLLCNELIYFQEFADNCTMSQRCAVWLLYLAGHTTDRPVSVWSSPMVVVVQAPTTLCPMRPVAGSVGPESPG